MMNEFIELGRKWWKRRRGIEMGTTRSTAESWFLASKKRKVAVRARMLSASASPPTEDNGTERADDPCVVHGGGMRVFERPRLFKATMFFLVRCGHDGGMSATYSRA